ncbi:hypothetical protein F5880DRAFT_1512650, partial [Lentinula raphanica]
IPDLDVDVQSAMLWDYIVQAQVSWFQKFERRKRDVESLLEVPTLNNLDRTNLQRTRDVLHALGAEGQSSEESGPEDALLVTIPHYRRQIVTEMMVDLDRRAKDMSKHQSRLLGRKSLPRPKHARVRSQQRSTRTVKKGLPCSLYHRRYLQQLSPPLREQLQIDSKEITGFEQWALAGQCYPLPLCSLFDDQDSMSMVRNDLKLSSHCEYMQFDKASKLALNATQALVHLPLTSLIQTLPRASVLPGQYAMFSLRNACEEPHRGGGHRDYLQWQGICDEILKDNTEAAHLMICVALTRLHQDTNAAALFQRI